MVTAWYYKESEAENTEPHQYSPSQPVSNEKLDELGVLQWHFDPDTEFDKVNELSDKRGYTFRDQIDIHKDRFPNYKEKLGIFATEHLHDDEESRYVLDGAGFFDIRGKDEKWIRIHVQKGDWIILPAGAYHRLFLDPSKYLKLLRLFKEDPKWTAFNRSPESDQMQVRADYVKSIA